jgi:acetoin utilization deacetylase AcuC-like enzyme
MDISDQATALIWSDRFRAHETGTHPENANRLVSIWRGLEQAGIVRGGGREIIEARSATVDDVARVHDRAYISRVEWTAHAGGGFLDADTYVSPKSFDVALLAAGSAIDAVDTVLGGKTNRVFAFPRPPGHHAESRRGMGFCLFNNIAVGASHALANHQLSRVAIIDWDVHHGNGTQEIFQSSRDVLFVSLHQSPLYPGTGQARDTGVGPGEGYTINLPLPPFSGDADYLHAFDMIVGPAVEAYAPDLIMVSAGFDAHADDPLANMVVTEAGFAALAERTRALAAELCGGRLVLLLEGGYNLDALADSVVATIHALDRSTHIEE